MALTVCCPCGNPLDCDHLELVVSLTCPRCQREISLEVQIGADRHAFGILTIMEGPYWVGEQFVMPIGQDLRIGKASGNWLSLDSDALSDTHCRLRLSDSGGVAIEDLGSGSGTWIGSQRILRGRLEPMQSFSAGGFRFRLDMPSPDGTTVAMTSPVPSGAETAGLPALGRVTSERSFPEELVSARFLWSRRAVFIFGWVAALHHACSLIGRPENPWPRPAAILMGLAIGAAFTAAARRITIAHRYSKYVTMLALLTLFVADIIWQLPGGALASLGMTAALAMILPVVPPVTLAITSGCIGALSLVFAIVLAIRSLIILFTS